MCFITVSDKKRQRETGIKNGKTELEIPFKGSESLQSQRQPWQNSHPSASISYLFLVIETCCHSDHFFLNLFTHPVDSEKCSIPHLLLLLMHTVKCFMLNTNTFCLCTIDYWKHQNGFNMTRMLSNMLFIVYNLVIYCWR